MTRVRMGTRGSALALWQAREIAARLAADAPGAGIELVEIASTGDPVVDVPLAQVEGTGFFTATHRARARRRPGGRRRAQPQGPAGRDHARPDRGGHADARARSKTCCARATA